MPLILPSRRLIRPNPLAYPVGAVAGIDRSHPASQQIALSAVSNGANFTDLVHGTQPGFGNGSLLPTTVMDGALGPSTNYAHLSQAVAFPGTVVAPTSGTFAVIARINSTANSDMALIMNASGFLFEAHGNGSTGYQPSVFTNSYQDSGFTILFGAPWFLVASGSLVSGGQLNFVAKNLATGQMLKSTVAVSSTFVNGNFGTIYAGNDNAPDAGAMGSIAAAMCSPNLALSMPQLLQWAEAPWSFWYPNRIDSWAASSAPVVVTPSVGVTLPMMGVG